MALFEDLYEKGNTLIVVTHEESIARMPAGSSACTTA
jgi:ABC-type lipoprotein export system ATPase subunit